VIVQGSKNVVSFQDAMNSSSMLMELFL